MYLKDIDVESHFGLTRYQNKGKYSLGKYVFEKGDERALYEFLVKMCDVECKSINLMVNFLALGSVTTEFSRAIPTDGALRY